MIAKFLDLLSLKYERTKTEKIQEIMEDWLNFKDDQFEDNGKLLLGIKELRQRQRDMNVTEDKWDAVWMLTVVKKQKRIDRFIHQALRDFVKLGGDNIVKNFEDKFKNSELQDRGSSSSVMYTKDGEKMDEDLPDNHYTEADMKEMETIFMGTKSKARRRFQKNGPYRPRSRPRSLS